MAGAQDSPPKKWAKRSAQLRGQRADAGIPARAAPADNQDIAEWLESRDLRYGIASYWNASNVTVTTNRRVTVVASPPKAVEHALVLVRVASRYHGTKLKAWDAVHIITAAGWARAIGDRVTVVTADGDFRRFFDLQGHFSALLDLEQVTE